MRKLILHAGRHKTGTTTLQNFLHGNTDLLSQHDFCYPRCGLKGNGHHEIGAAMTRANIRTLGTNASKALDDYHSMLQHAIENNSSAVIISSEAFQNCDPAIVRKFFDRFDTEVVIYLREPTGYLISSYAQKIQASRCTDTIEEYCKSIFKDHYGEFVDNWQRAFGSNLRLRVYERNELIRQDIVHDFMTGILGIEEEQVDEHYTKTNANPTLSRALLEYKRAINHCEPLPKEHDRLLFNKLAVLAKSDQSGKITVSRQIVENLRCKFESSNKSIARKYFNREHLFSPFQENLVCDPPEITSHEFRTIRAKLVELSPELDTSLPDL